MLSWDEEVKPASPLNYARNPSGNDAVAQAPVSSVFAAQTSVATQATMSQRSASGQGLLQADIASKHPDKRIINGQTDVNPVGPVQVQVGLGKIPRHLRQSLDASRGQHDA